MNEQAEIITCPCCGQEAPDLDGIILDPSTNRIFHRGQELTLAGTQFKVVRFLVKARGQVKTKDSIYDDLYWQRIAEDDYPDLKNVDVQVCKVRPKLHSIGLNILTEWGVGYRLVETEAHHDL